jgi:hypothetical protein
MVKKDIVLILAVVINTLLFGFLILNIIIEKDLLIGINQTTT